MGKIAKTEVIEWKKLLKEHDRGDLYLRCFHYVKSEGEDELSKEQILEKLIEQFPEKIEPEKK